MVEEAAALASRLKHRLTRRAGPFLQQNLVLEGLSLRT